jgi:hypothetical protein
MVGSDRGRSGDIGIIGESGCGKSVIRSDHEPEVPAAGRSSKAKHRSAKTAVSGLFALALFTRAALHSWKGDRYDLPKR